MDKVNILVVDDRPEGILSVQAVLNNPEYNLITASSGTDALKHLLVYDFAVILMDVQMPIMNGFDTAALIKTRDSSRDIPIIFMSAINQDEHYVYQGYNVGAVDYLLKPFDPYILRSKVSIFVDIFKKNKLIQEQAKRLYENELATYAQALDRMEIESLRRYQYLADAIPQIVFQIRPDGKNSYFNKVWFEYTGYTSERSLDLGWTEALHPDDQPKLNQLFEDGFHEEYEFEGRLKNRDGRYRWHLFRIQPEYYSGSQAVSSWLGTATDIEDRKQNEDTHRFLAKAGELLVSSLDYETSFSSVASLAVPQLADWCSIDIMSEGKWHNVAIVHRDPEKLEWAKQLQFGFLMRPQSKVGVGRVMATSKTEVYTQIDDELKTSLAADDEQLELSRKLNDKSAIIVPLTAQGRTFGAITFVFSDSDRSYNENYIQVAEELGRRCALAYENSRLYRISQEAIEIRNEFLSIASHELNTPITSLKLHLQMVKRSMGSGNIVMDKFVRSIDASTKQVDRLINLIEVLLDVSRIQSGRLTFNFEEFDVVEVIRDISERYKEILQNTESSLSLRIPEKLFVTWDKMRIEQVIINLLTNAIKYAPGKIELSLEEMNNQVKLKLQDHGEGIPEEKLESIFERFERASSNRNIGGLGLGLFIVKQIVDGHNGHINVVSRPGEGTCFEVTLPPVVSFRQQPITPIPLS